MNTFQTRSSISLPDDNFHPLTSLRPESSSSSINPGNNTVELTAITRAIEPHRRILGAILTHPIANLNRLIGRWSIDAQWNRLAPSFASALPLSLSLSLSLWSGEDRLSWATRVAEASAGLESRGPCYRTLYIVSTVADRTKPCLHVCHSRSAGRWCQHRGPSPR